MARILVVAEEQPLFDVLRATLERAGHAVVRAERGKQEAGAGLGDGVELVVTDSRLPDWCGPEFLRELRRRSPGGRVIALTGGGPASPVGYLPAVARFGAVCTLAKPFAPSELLDAVRWALAHESPSGEGGGRAPGNGAS